MKDTVYLKKDIRMDHLWENTPPLAFLFWMFLGIAVMTVSLFVSAFAIVDKHMPEALIWIFLATEFILFTVVIPLYRNKYCNLSRSIGFIKRDNVLYAIKLTYGNISIDLESDDIAPRRLEEETYISALDELLKHFTANPQTYYYKKERGRIEFSCPYDVLGVDGFLILDEPRIEKEARGYIWISYNDRYGGRTTIKFRNAYGKLNEVIR